MTTCTIPEWELALTDMAESVVTINKMNGWFDDDRTVLDECMLLVTEVAEMAEAFRDGEMEVWLTLGDISVRADGPHADAFEGGTPKPVGFPTECADVMIRLLDTCYRHGINLAAEVERKLEYNATRGYRHGGKVL